jgi:hypothetical protein
MKHTSVFLIALTAGMLMALTAPPVAAQSSPNYLGLFAGQNRANLIWDGPDDLDIDFSSRNEWMYGGVLGTGLSGNFDIQLAPAYVGKGAERTFFDPELEEISSSIELSTIELPVLLRISFNKAGINPYLLAGGTVSYLLEAREKFGQEYAEFGYQASDDIRDRLTTWDYGYSYGGGISIPLGGLNLFLEGRYQRGLGDINDIENDPAELFTEGMEYLAGVTFPVGQGGDVFFGRQPGAPPPKKPKKPPKTDTSTRTRARKDSCEIGAELGIRILNPFGKVISGKKKLLFNVIKPGMRVDSNCQVVVQAQNSAVCPYPGKVTFTFYRGDKGETLFHTIEGRVTNDEDLRALLDQPAPRVSAPPGMSPSKTRKVEFIKVVGRYLPDQGDSCKYSDKTTIIWRYNGSQSAGTFRFLNPDIRKVSSRPPKHRSRIRYNPEIIEEKTGFRDTTNHATEVVVDFSVDEAFGCCEHANKHYAIIQFVRHRWQLGKDAPVRHDAWNLDGPDSQADNRKAGRPYDPTYAAGGSPLFSVGPWNQKGGDAISVRDYPGLLTDEHERFRTRGGFMEWHFWTLLVCRETPGTNETYLADGEVQAITHFTIRREYDLKRKKIFVKPSIFKKDRKYFDPCVPLRTVLTDRGLLEAYNNPREHELPLGD